MNLRLDALTTKQEEDRTKHEEDRTKHEEDRMKQQQQHEEDISGLTTKMDIQAADISALQKTVGMQEKKIDTLKKDVKFLCDEWEKSADVSRQRVQEKLV
jgi:hypothetical protein